MLKQEINHIIKRSIWSHGRAAKSDHKQHSFFRNKFRSRSRHDEYDKRYHRDDWNGLTEIGKGKFRILNVKIGGKIFKMVLLNIKCFEIFLNINEMMEHFTENEQKFRWIFWSISGAITFSRRIRTDKICYKYGHAVSWTGSFTIRIIRYVFFVSLVKIGSSGVVLKSAFSVFILWQSREGMFLCGFTACIRAVCGTAATKNAERMSLW